ncbi:PRC-barrel domain-containing protein [Rhodocista pekingensis]|uniref:PRC-barrel domain-containing protein n=1 Tax=Rhodocista pekingensis TaxID=201185 RepID=A0ABW2KT05_9PROT
MRKELIGAASAAALLVCGTAWAQSTATQPDDRSTTTTQSTTTQGSTSPGTMGQGTTSTSPGMTSPSTTTQGSTAQGTTSGSTMGGSATAGRTSAEKLMGKTVVDASGEELGDVKDVIMDANTGEARQIVISSGGFLGIGAKDIAVPFQQAQIQQGSEEITVTGLTRNQVEQMPEFEYDENTVSLSRDRGQSETNSTTTTTRSGSGSGQ